MSSRPSTVNEATCAPLSSTILHSLFCGVFSTGDGVEYTGLEESGVGVTAMEIPGLPAAALSSERNGFAAAEANDGHGDEVADGEEVCTEEEDEMGDGWTKEEGGIKAAGTAMVSSSSR